jgi:hypothetical protein
MEGQLEQTTVEDTNFVLGPPSEITTPAPVRYVTVSSFQWEEIRRAVEKKLSFPFLWFHDAGLFCLSQLPAIGLFILGWGPVYDGLAGDAQLRYALVDLGMKGLGVLFLGLGAFFLFLDLRMKDHVKGDAGDVLGLMDSAHARPKKEA